jgi:hypothetical protein
LNVNTTYDPYVYAVHSGRVQLSKLLPPEPSVNVSFVYDLDSPFRFHGDCTSAGMWSSQSERLYNPSDPEVIITDLLKYKNHFWCHHCGRGLFFTLTSNSHADTEVFVGGDVANLDDVDLDDLFLN